MFQRSDLRYRPLEPSDWRKDAAKPVQLRPCALRVPADVSHIGTSIKGMIPGDSADEAEDHVLQHSIHP